MGVFFEIPQHMKKVMSLQYHITKVSGEMVYNTFLCPFNPQLRIFNRSFLPPGLYPPTPHNFPFFISVIQAGLELNSFEFWLSVFQSIFPPTFQIRFISIHQYIWRGGRFFLCQGRWLIYFPPRNLSKEKHNWRLKISVLIPKWKFPQTRGLIHVNEQPIVQNNSFQILNFDWALIS